jgi:hypothetical protein
LAGDRVAVESDRAYGLFAACVDSSDDLFHVLADGAARRSRGLGEPIGDRIAIEADCARGLFAARVDASDNLVHMFGHGVAGRR